MRCLCLYVRAADGKLGRRAAAAFDNLRLGMVAHGLLTGGAEVPRARPITLATSASDFHSCKQLQY